MAASRRTIQDIADVVVRYANDPLEMAEALARIRGNASFETTTALLLEEIRRRTEDHIDLTTRGGLRPR